MKASRANHGWMEPTLPGKTPTPRMPTPLSRTVVVSKRRSPARISRTAAAMTARPVTIIVRSKIVADGCRMTLSGGRVAPRSLISLEFVVYSAG
jgi:hypothetical protein